MVGQYVDRRRDEPTLDEVLELAQPRRARASATCASSRRGSASSSRSPGRSPAGRRLLLLDEPAAGLDTTESAWLADRLRAVRDGGVTILLVDHDMSLVLGLCDEIHVLDFGTADRRRHAAEVIRAIPPVAEAYLGGRRHTHRWRRRDRTHPGSLACEGLSVGYDGLAVARGIDLEVRRRRGAGRARAERRRQDHPAAHPRRASCRRSPARSRSTAQPSGRARPAGPTGPASCSCPTPGPSSPSSPRSRTSRLASRKADRPRRRGARPVPRAAAPGRACAAGRSPAASSRCSPSPGRSCRSRGSCSSTR